MFHATRSAKVKNRKMSNIEKWMKCFIEEGWFVTHSTKQGRKNEMRIDYAARKMMPRDASIYPMKDFRGGWSVRTECLFFIFIFICDKMKRSVLRFGLRQQLSRVSVFNRLGNNNHKSTISLIIHFSSLGAVWWISWIWWLVIRFLLFSSSFQGSV